MEGWLVDLGNETGWKLRSEDLVSVQGLRQLVEILDQDGRASSPLIRPRRRC